MRGNTALLEDIKAVKKNLNTSSETITNAHTTFTNQFTSFMTLADQLENKIRELEEREIAVEKRENEAKVKTQQLDDRERKCAEKEKGIEERDQALKAKEAKWNETEKRMAENVSRLPNMIPLNVSGKNFTIAKEKLLQYQGSAFHQMLVTDHPPLLSNTGRMMFIERDPELFTYIARFLVTGKLVMPQNADEHELLRQEFEFFKIPFGQQTTAKPITKADANPAINLNVSGTRFTVSQETLLQHKGSLFESLIAGQSGGEIFIGRDARLFKRLVWFMLHGKLIPPLKVDVKLLQKEFEYFKIPFKCPIQSTLLERTNFGDRICEWLPNKEFQLLFKASRDGFPASEFHKNCDNKGSTFVLICSNGYLFGGYSVIPWDSTTNGYKNNPEGFIFTLSNPHNIPPTKYCRNPQVAHSIYCQSSYGPVFGNGNDIYVPANMTTGSSNFSGSHSYLDTTGKAGSTFTGATDFTISDIEVFAVL